MTMAKAPSRTMRLRPMVSRWNGRATIDELAPLYWVRADCPPIVLVCGDREQELFGRYDENQYFARMMKLVGHKQTYLYELDGYDHGDMIGPGLPVVLKHIRKMTTKQGE